MKSNDADHTVAVPF